MPFKSGGDGGGRGNSGGISGGDIGGDGGGTGNSIDTRGNLSDIFHHRSQFKNNARMKIRA